MSISHDLYTEYDWLGEGRVRETGGDLDGALKAYEEALKMNPGFATAWYRKALVHHRLGQKTEAAACAKKVIELKPEWEKHVKQFL